VDIYTIDPATFQRATIVENFNSCIWTERFTDAGDITLTIGSTADTQAQLVEGTLLVNSDSDEVAIIETASTENGILTATGPFITGFLKQRMLIRDLKQDPSNINGGGTGWQFTNYTPAQIMNEIVKEMCVKGGVMDQGGVISTGAAETIPNLSVADPAAGTQIQMAISYGDVFTGVQSVATAYNIGFRIKLANVTGTTYNLIFETYAGVDRTSAQTTNPVVRFQPELESLSGLKEVHSISGYKNVAVAVATAVTTTSAMPVQIAYADSTSQASRGFARRTLFVDVTDLTDNDAKNASAFNNMLLQRAKNALINNNYVKYVDGTLVPGNTMYEYGVDYLLGDVIELKASDGLLSQARVTEYIRSQDSTGETAYPTLSVIGEDSTST